MGGGTAAPALSIAWPPNGATLRLGAPDRLRFTATGGTRPLRWLVNRRPIDSVAYRRDASWPADGPGFVSVTVIDAKGAVARTDFEVIQDNGTP